MILSYRFIFYTSYLFLLMQAGLSQTDLQPVARFTFDDAKDYDEISHRKIKRVNVNFTDDRFGNADHAVFISGNDQSYINLGDYPAIKPTTGSISLWVRVYEKVWSGRGHYINPVILTKSTTNNDFYESYAIYYGLNTNGIGLCVSQDSLKQISICSAAEFERFKWHHLVLSYDDEYCAFYIDGKQEARVLKGYRTTFLPGDSVLVGATGNKKNARYLMAAVDDILFYDRMLSPQEVQQLYKAPDPDQSKVVVMWIIVSLVFVVILTGLYFFTKYRIRKAVKKAKDKFELDNKLLETELRVNRASMNPHFLFNSLNALHNFILAEQTENASNYLVKFSKLIRKITESNMYDSIPLKMEIEILEHYLEVENMRFTENISYTFITDEALEASDTHIPIMMLQPFVENAVWHGLLNKAGEKTITLSFSLHEQKYVYCVIEDNGIGREAPKAATLDKKSLGTVFIMQRLELLNKIHGLHCTLEIEDKPHGRGTIVRILLPVLNP